MLNSENAAKAEMMLRHCYPVNHRPSRLRERRDFYGKEFDVKAMESWFNKLPKPLRRPIFFMDLGSETGYVRGQYRGYRGKLLSFTIGDYNEVVEMCLEYLPEDLYYDRNMYRDPEKCEDCGKRGDRCFTCPDYVGQEVMFDLDPENINCPNCGTLEDRIRGKSLYRFCFICFNKSREEALRLCQWLESRGLKKLEVVYSGRGFHIHVEDDLAYAMRVEERAKLAEEAQRSGFHIDPWVTGGGSRLARAPFSLNGLVSKIAKPVSIGELSKIDFLRGEEFMPMFLREASGTYPSS